MRYFETSFSVALSSVLILIMLPQFAVAQQQDDTQWRQTVQVLTTVEDDGATGAFLDSLVAVVERENMEVMRSEDNEARTSFAQLEDEILSEGVDFSSANRVFISYKFEAGRRGFRTVIEDMYFIYRPESGADMDISIMYVDLTQPELMNLLYNSGMQLRTNEVALVPFHEQLQFHNLNDSELVALGGDIIRDEHEAERERQRVLRTVRNFLY